MSERAGWNIYNYYVDRDSGTTDKRKAFKRMMEDAENSKFDCILVKEFSRIARNVLLSYQFKGKMETNKVHIVSLDNAINTLTNEQNNFGLLAWIYEGESIRTSKRIKSTFKTKAERGEFTGSNPPYGYIVEKKKLFIRDDSTVDAVKLIFHLYLQGKGHEAIAKEMDTKGYPTPRSLSSKLQSGLYWQGSTVKSILKNTHYVGDLAQCRSSKKSLFDKNREDIPKKIGL